MSDTRGEDEKEDEAEEEEDEDTPGVPLVIGSQGSSLDKVCLEIGSNRTSLIITHDDGTVEENEGEVTCLGLTPDVDRRSRIIIEEISQENKTSPGLEEAAAAPPDPQVRFNNY